MFHVQTEDSGLLNPHLFTNLFYEGVIVSTRKLVYDAGSIEDGSFRAASSNSDRMATIVATYTQSGASGQITRTKAELVRIVHETSTAPGRMCGAGAIMFCPIFLFSLAWRSARRRGSRLIFRLTNAE